MSTFSGEDQTANGHALIDRAALYLPEEWACRRRAPPGGRGARGSGLRTQTHSGPPDGGARAGGGSVSKVGGGDSVYGGDGKLRQALEEAGQPYVMAVTGQQSVWLGSEPETRQDSQSPGSPHGVEESQRGSRRQGAARL